MKQFSKDRHGLSKLLEITPLVFEGDPLLLVELPKTRIEKDIWAYVQKADHPDLVPNERTILLGPTTYYYDRWPAVRILDKAPKDLGHFNRCLFKNFDQVQGYAFNQKQIAHRILEDTEVDVIVLLLIDGLSYTDWSDYPNVSSCLVPGPSITPVGFRNILGKPTIAEQLFEKGITNRIGFSHWDRDEKLSNILFYGFDPKLQINKISEFKEIYKHISVLPKTQTYIQILVNGMDFISHHHRGRPPSKALAKELYDSFIGLCDYLHKKRITAFVYATSDHGILWKPNPDETWPFIQIPEDKKYSHRYVSGSLLIPHSHEFTCYGRTYQSLEYPYLIRKISSLEWGVHGGISFQESVVPFAKEEVY
jgi:hypothetical protein